ncbi:MAG: prepilin-type N-terminal cleavage/methylation domain-containing protein [Ruminococcus sp.]|nr:prepilin-type N-terminal cleavage/methylation domain-containing protein [Ruminococcus sp.]
MKNKRTLKGFTLVELIVVMAVFGIIMLGALQFLDPVGKMMKGASLQEANSATVDNIKRYFEGTLRYASAVYVHNGDLKEYDADTGQSVVITGTDEKDRQTKAVTNFVESYFRDKADSSNKPIEGQVNVMKIDNDHQGRITESVFNFEAGYTYQDWNAATSNWDITTIEPCTVTNVSMDQPVINDVYYKDYSIFASLGYNTLNPIDDSVEGLPAKVTKDQYFGCVNPVLIKVGEDDTTGEDILAPYTFGKDMFSFTFVTYKNEDGTKKYHDTLADGRQVFGSPYAASNATLALVNINNNFTTYNESLNYRPVRRNGKGNGTIDYTPTTMVDECTAGTPPTKESDGKWDYEEIPVPPPSFYLYDSSNNAGGNNIYIIYTLN